MKNYLKLLAFFLILIFNFPNSSHAQKHQQRLQEIDIQHYRFQLKLNDTTNVIKGQATITISFLKEVNQFYLDLVAFQEGLGTGMQVQSIQDANEVLNFQHQGNQLLIKLKTPAQAGVTKTIIIDYRGIPADGLVIKNNKYGDRTFFGDNWPNRAHHWLPTVDHPADKATVEFIVIAPNHYQVVANGIQIEETDLSDKYKLTHWKEEARLPTKIMVIGVARFAVHLSGHLANIPIESWVYPQNREEGFFDYHQAIKVLKFFIEKLGPYPYKKLANVQSNTRYGGMENANTIFYAENSVTGQRQHERLIAHEIAHQWFGDSASETNWYHIWLSEGFATYLSSLYFEETVGIIDFSQRMQEARETVIDYAKQELTPVINTKIKDYNRLLNANSYQKGAWVLHMLRQKIGDKAFWKTLRQYHKKFHLSNALSEDFQKVAEKVSGENLSKFFQQWLYQAGHPVVQISWKTVKKKKLKVDIQQTQDGALFSFPLDLLIETESGQKLLKTVEINTKEEEFSFKVKGEVTKITLDPDVKLLFEKR